jgi:hypothetical protein
MNPIITPARILGFIAAVLVIVLFSFENWPGPTWRKRLWMTALGFGIVGLIAYGFESGYFPPIMSSLFSDSLKIIPSCIGISLAMAVPIIWNKLNLPKKMTFTILGTGFMPMQLGDVMLNRFNGISFQANCQICKERVEEFGNIARDYLTFLYIPLFPLFRLGTLMECKNCGALFPVYFDLNSESVSRRFSDGFDNERGIGLWGTWWFPALFSILGAVIGYFGLSQLFSNVLSSGCLIGLLIIINIPMIIINVASPHPNTAYMFISRIAGALISIVVSIYFMPQYPQIIAAFWGMAILTSIYRARTLTLGH